MKFLISSNPNNLKNELNKFTRTATVEAEYGQVVVEGSVKTLAHHTGEWIGRPAPCSFPNGCAGPNVEVVGLSHFDLDALGGCAAILGRKPEDPAFWTLAAFIDLNGAHRLKESGADETVVQALQAFWAWSQKNRVFPPRDGSVADITDKIEEGVRILWVLLDPTDDQLSERQALLEEGRKMVAAEAALNAESFTGLHVAPSGRAVAFRSSDKFVNHLYVAPAGEIADAVVSFNPETGACTVSFANPPKGKNARDIVQEIFTDRGEDGKLLAGGHAGIAGSPRSRRATVEEVQAIIKATVMALE